MATRLKAGHEANAYTLEDWSELIEEYERCLAPHLSLSDLKDLVTDSRLIVNEPTVLETMDYLRKIIQRQDSLIRQLQMSAHKSS